MVRALDGVLELSLLVSEDMTTSLARIGLTPSRTHLLWVLREEGACTQRVLADRLGVSPRNVTGLVDALEDTGFVVRKPHPDDRRATLVDFTARGAATVATMEQQQQEFAELLFGGLPARSVDEFRATLEIVVQRLRARLEEGASRG